MTGLDLLGRTTGARIALAGLAVAGIIGAVQGFRQRDVKGLGPVRPAVS